MRLTTRTNLAARVLMYCAVNTDRLVRSSEIARVCNASSNHIAHVVNQLQAEGLVDTVRGRTGGLQLAQPPEMISIGSVFRIFESGIPFAECFDPETNTCPLAGSCRLRRYVERALDAFYQELEQVTLADLVQGNCGLQQLLETPDRLRPDCIPPMN